MNCLRTILRNCLSAWAGSNPGEKPLHSSPSAALLAGAERAEHPRRLTSTPSRLTSTDRTEWKALRTEGSVGEVDYGCGGSEPAP